MPVLPGDDVLGGFDPLIILRSHEIADPLQGGVDAFGGKDTGHADAPNQMLLGRKSQQQIDGQGHRHMDGVLEEILLAAQGAQNTVWHGFVFHWVSFFLRNSGFVEL